MNSQQSDYQYIQCQNPHGQHRMAYREWGDRQNDKVLICLHGVSGSSGDFLDVAIAWEYFAKNTVKLTSENTYRLSS